MNNAQRFTDSGSITARATLESEQVKVTVADTGIGIPPSEHEDMFKEFYQVEELDARGRVGHGLGLALCKRFIEMHGGRIWVESDGVPGHGSQFHFTLPVAGAERVEVSAAEIDGCSKIGIFFRIILLLIQPALITAAIFSFYWTWEDFLGPLLYLQDPHLYTVSLAVRAYSNPDASTDWGSIFAMSSLSLVPVCATSITSPSITIPRLASYLATQYNSNRVEILSPGRVSDECG